MVRMLSAWRSHQAIRCGRTERMATLALEVVSLFDVLDHLRVGGVPAQQLAGDLVRRGVVHCHCERQEPEVVRGILGAYADCRQVELAANRLSDVLEWHTLFAGAVQP